jgi:hypothetical protein
MLGFLVVGPDLHGNGVVNGGFVTVGRLSTDDSMDFVEDRHCRSSSQGVNTMLAEEGTVGVNG